MNQKKLTAILLGAAVAAAALTGCGDSSAKTVDISQQPKQGEQEQGQPGQQRQRGVMAKVVSLDGDQLTVIPADMPERNAEDADSVEDTNGAEEPAAGVSVPAVGETPSPGSSTLAASGTDPVQPTDGNAPPDGARPPAGENGQMPDPGTGPGQPGQAGGEIEFTKEEVTYTLSADVTISKGTGENAAEMDLSELAAGDVIRFTTNTDENGNETIDTIVVME